MRDRGEKRLYVVVAGTVQVPVSTAPGPDRGTRTVIQPWGRQAAQACHAVGLFRYRQGHFWKLGEQGEPYQDITTIILQARDSAEMNHVMALLSKKKIMYHHFCDSNPEYGNARPITALCTEPIYKDQIVNIADYLPLWSPGK